MLFLGLGLIAVFLFFAYLMVNTMRLPRNAEDVEPIAMPAVDTKHLSQLMSEAVKIKTISTPQMTEKEYRPFLEFHQWFKSAFPHVHKTLSQESINQYSLLFTWSGSEPSLKPVLVSAHMDVVPVEEATLKDWKVDPFTGEIKEGFVWGRGTLDMKHHIVATFAAIEQLLTQGYTPKRTLYFALGHDEEISGKNGARHIAAHLKRKNVKLAAVLDEGGMICRGLLPGIEQDIAVIGIGEKEYATVNLTTQGSPGHSATPPRQTAIGILARAIALLDDHPMPPRLDYVLPTLKQLAFLFPFPMQIALANPSIFRGIITKSLQQKKQTNAMMRTTHAATVIQGGIKDNILPAEASAKVNFRILPGEGVDSVLAHIHKVVDDPRVKVEIDDADAWGPSKVSHIDTPAYRSLELVIRQMFENPPVAPLLLMFATDARHYQKICDQLLHFTPLRLSTQDMGRLHGIDERIAIEDLGKMVQFFLRLINVWGDAEF